MSSKAVKISIVLLCILALLIPSPANSAAGEISSVQITTPTTGAFVSTEVNPISLNIGGTALVSVKLNNVPVEGYKSAEFTCTYSAGLVEKSNIAFTALFGAEPVTAIHDPQNGAFIVAIAGMNSNRATTSGVAFTFSARGLQAGQTPIQCAARVSTGNNLAIDIPSIGAALTILDAQVSPTPFGSAPVTPDPHGHPTAESPTPVTTGSLSGQILASKPVTIRLLDANQVEITSLIANPDGTFTMTPLPGDYTLIATASGFLSYYGSATITAGSPSVYPAVSLVAGDVDGNLVIDQFDALTIGMNYTTSTPEAADLNNDGIIDFLDLELLAENYRLTGPTIGTANSSIQGLLQKIKPKATGSPIPGLTKTVIAPVATSSPIPGLTQTVITPAATLITGQTGANGAFLGAPLCPAHDPSKWHGLWDGVLGCHYDHEHGQDPFTPAVAAAFPGFDLRALLGNVGIGHTNPSSPVENTHKHGGFKWQVDVAAPQGCRTGFEDGTIAVKSYAIQFHSFGRQDVEHEARNHSSVALLAFCKSDNPNDVGYMYVTQLQEYGQRVMPYQGFVMPYPDSFQPTYISPRGPYFTTECFGNDFSFVDLDGTTRLVDCRDAGDTRNNNNTIWTSKPTGNGARPFTPLLFRMLFRGRDNYQRVDVTDLVHPYTWRWVCGGVNYAPVGCRFNSSTMTINEVMGDIPAAWDGLAGFDTDPRPGRITAQGFVTRFGDLNLACTVAGGDCYPIKLVSAFVGRYSSELSVEKVTNPDPFNTPERDIYFCNGAPCRETDPGAVPSGWIGTEN
ncbi:MAG TPA: hypothetical protein VMJ90_10015 [Anaerolineales bacterium]|nr:hypothetical protein [Anaerolineales bacterium]